MLQLEVLLEWLQIHVNTVERWESRKYFGFASLVQSISHANTIAKILSI